MSRLKTDAIRNVNASVDGITLDTSGNVAIPNELQLADKIVHTGDTNTLIRFPSADTVSVETGGDERLRIDSSGRILVGTTSHKSNLNSSADSSGQLAQFVGAADNTNKCVGIFAYSGTSNPTARGAKLQLNRARSTDGSTNTALANNDLIGVIEWKGNDGTSFSSAAKIDCFVEDTSVTADHMGGRLVFSTSADGSAVPTERLRITSTGQVRLNTAGTPAADLHVGGTGAALNAYFQTSRSSGAYHHYAIGNSGASLGYIGSAGQISASGGGTSFAVRSEGDLQFCAGGGTERLRIDSSGNASIGGIAPVPTDPAYNKALLHIHQTQSGTYGSELHLTNNTTGSAAGDGMFLSMWTDNDVYFTNQEAGDINFTTNGHEAFKIQSNKNVEITDGDLKFANGHGINFYPYDNASSNPGSDNNLLSDYERGTWVPADGSSGSLTLTVTSASYVKVGELVFINFYVTYPTNNDGATAYISGLPFTAKGANNYAYLTGRIGSMSNNVAVQVNAGSTTLHIYVGDSAYMNSQLSGKYILVSGCYNA